MNRRKEKFETIIVRLVVAIASAIGILTTIFVYMGSDGSEISPKIIAVLFVVITGLVFGIISIPETNSSKHEKSHISCNKVSI